MKESVTYQEILLQGEVKGIAKGKAEGLIEGEIKGMAKEKNQIALNILHSGISIELIDQFTGLTIEQIQSLEKA